MEDRTLIEIVSTFADKFTSTFTGTAIKELIVRYEAARAKVCYLECRVAELEGLKAERSRV